MKLEIIPFTNEANWLDARRNDITSTQVAALFNESPYLSRFQLFHLKRNGFEDEFDLDARVKWGQRLQDSIAHGVAEDEGWSVMPLRDYMRLPDLHLGSSFDYRVLGAGPHDDRSPQEDAILECKNVDGLVFRDQWVAFDQDFGLEAPLHIELQLQTQLLVSGLKLGYIAALVGGNRVVLLRREYLPDVGQRILEETEAFWKGGEPSPNFHRDAEFISKLYKHAEPGAVITATDNVLELMRKYREAGAIAKEADDAKKAAKAELLTLIGAAEKVITDEGLTISAKVIPPKIIESYERTGYRDFRVTQRKIK